MNNGVSHSSRGSDKQSQNGNTTINTNTEDDSSFDDVAFLCANQETTGVPSYGQARKTWLNTSRSKRMMLMMMMMNKIEMIYIQLRFHNTIVYLYQNAYLYKHDLASSFCQILFASYCRYVSNVANQ